MSLFAVLEIQSVQGSVQSGFSLSSCMLFHLSLLFLQRKTKDLRLEILQEVTLLQKRDF